MIGSRRVITRLLLGPGLALLLLGLGVPALADGFERSNWSFDAERARISLGCAEAEHVDHVVALKEAYDSGAADWSRERKAEFANDSLNLWCFDASLNLSKADHDLAEWSGGSCAQRRQIAWITVEVKRKYKLSVDPAEAAANQQALVACCA